MSGTERRVVYFRKLLFENSNENSVLEELRLKKMLQSGLEVGDT